MQVFRCFFYILNQYKMTLIIYIAVFLGLTFAFSGTSEKNDQDVFSTYSMRIGIIDEDGTDASKALIRFLEKESINVPVKNDREELQDMMFYRDIEYVLYIPKNYETMLKKGEEPVLKNVKIPNSYTGSFMDIKINTYENILSTYLKNNLQFQKALDKTEATLAQSADVKVINESGMGEQTPNYFFFYTYYCYVIVMILILGMGNILIQFNKKDVRNRTLCSSLRETKFNLQIGFGCFVYAFGIWLFMNVIAIIIYHNQAQFLKNLPYMMLNSFVMTCVGASLAFLSGMIAKTPSGASGFGNVFGLGLSFLGGVFVPHEMMSENLLKFSQFVPSYWYMKIIRLLKVSGIHDSGEWIEFGKGIVLQIAFIAAILGITLMIKKSTKGVWKVKSTG